MANKFIVPKSEQHAYKMLVQRANRRVKSNLKYINQNKITNSNTRRSLVASFTDPMKWASRSMPFSRSNTGYYLWDEKTEQMKFKEFESEREFRQHVAQLEKWGKEGRVFDTNPKQIINDYKSSIIKSLNQIKDQYNITLPDGKLPKEILDALNEMTIEEITNFYANGDPSEDMEISQFNSDDYLNVETADDFISVVMSRIYSVKKFNKSEFREQHDKHIKEDILDYYKTEYRKQDKISRKHRFY